MRKRAILITGVVGEIGQALIEALAGQNDRQLVTLDLKPLPAGGTPKSSTSSATSWTTSCCHG